MADISKIQIESGTYDIKDSGARTLISGINTNIGDLANLTTPVNTSIVNAINSIDKLRIDDSLPVGTTFHLIAGAIRQNENNVNEWGLISDSNHQPIGISSVVLQGNYIRINYSQSYDKVISLVATPDESLASLNITTGGSVGLDHTLITLGCRNRVKGEIYYDGSNWVDTNNGSLTFSNGILTITPNVNTAILSPYGFEIETITRGYTTYKNAVRLESGLRVSFFDASGNKLTTASNDMAFNYWFTTDGFIYPYTKMPAGSNIWILGIMAKYPASEE